MATNRRNALKGGLSLIGAAVAAGATRVRAQEERHPVMPVDAQLVLHGRDWRVSSRDIARGELPTADLRMLTRGELIDAPEDGRTVGSFFATYYRLNSVGKATAEEPGSLELHTFVFPDGTIVGSGVASAAAESDGHFAIVGGTGKYLAVRGAYVARQSHIDLGGDGTATFTFTFV